MTVLPFNSSGVAHHCGRHQHRGNHNPPNNQAVSNNVVRYSSSYSSTSTTSRTMAFDGLKVFESVITKTEQSLQTHRSCSKTSSLDNFSAISKLSAGDDGIAVTAEKVADKILGFIEQRLQKEAAEGASPEQLAERLAQGLAGFEKGFSEAREEIKALGLLSPSVEDNIQKTYELVTGGISDLADKFSGPDVPPAIQPEAKEDLAIGETVDQSSSKAEPIAATTGEQPSVQKTSSNTVTRLSSATTTDSMQNINSATQSESSKQSVGTLRSFNAAAPSMSESAGAMNAQYSYGLYNTFSFEVETADGDVVTVTASDKSVYAAQYSNGFGASDFASKLHQEGRFDIEIQGELDDAELNALSHLLEQVDNLAASFYEGDVAYAFQQATSLGYDANEIIGYSLNLKQVEIEKVQLAYAQVAPASDTPVLADQLSPIGDFAQKLLEAVKEASVFEDPKEVVQGVAETLENARETQKSVLDENQGQPFSDFVAKLLEAMPNVDRNDAPIIVAKTDGSDDLV